ncbi:hypothetical protein [Actinosynnema sp. NPDC020468]|uniref:hypothetical protein n=1 Tax=Actinosynnema sp. NPDC020468 TaxID=3154488 RepID=UPI0033C3F1B8
MVPDEVDTAARFGELLAELHARSGAPDVPGAAAGFRGLPSRRQLDLLLTSCAVPPEEWEAWRAARGRVLRGRAVVVAPTWGTRALELFTDDHRHDLGVWRSRDAAARAERDRRAERCQELVDQAADLRGRISRKRDKVQALETRLAEVEAARDREQEAVRLLNDQVKLIGEVIAQVDAAGDRLAELRTGFEEERGEVEDLLDVQLARQREERLVREDVERALEVERARVLELTAELHAREEDPLARIPIRRGLFGATAVALLVSVLLLGDGSPVRIAGVVGSGVLWAVAGSFAGVALARRTAPKRLGRRPEGQPISSQPSTSDG